MRLRAYAALLVAIGGITWSAIFVRWAGVPGTASAFYRVLIAGAVLIPWAVFAIAAAPKAQGISRRAASAEAPAPKAAWLAVAGGVFFALGFAPWDPGGFRARPAPASPPRDNTPFFLGCHSWLWACRLSR